MPDHRDKAHRHAAGADRPARNTTREPSARSGLTVTTAVVADSRVLTFYGVFDATTYPRMRDAMFKAAALDGCRGVIVDVTRLVVTTPVPWSQFTSACKQPVDWPRVPIALVCERIAGQKALRRSGISGEIPVYWSVAPAIAALPGAKKHPRRRPTRAESHPESRWLAGWPTTPLATVQAAQSSGLSRV